MCMKCLAAAALVVVSIALPALGQRASSHSGFSGHASAAPHAGFAPRSGRTIGVRGPGSSMRPQRPIQRNASGAFISRPPYSRPGTPPYGRTGSDHHRRPYIPAYRSGYGYGVVGYSIPEWIGPGYLGYGDADEGGDGSAQQTAAGDNGAGADQSGELGPYEQAPPLPPYPPQPAETHAAAPQAPQDAVTLIFKDGRPPEQIRNYILTGKTLYVGDRRPSEIAVGELDLPETVRVNSAAGVDFRLPSASN
jgi:hypothetical protein